MSETDTKFTRPMHISDFPSALHDEIADRLALSSVGFSTIKVVDDVEHSMPSGSGTLVLVRGRRAILTADHVIDDLKKADRISLLIDWTGRLRRCAYERQQLSFARLARGKDDGKGPDLALVLLPPLLEATSALVAHKVFYDLDRRVENLPGSYAGIEWGFWFPCGVPAEGSQELGPMLGFSSVRTHWGLCAVAAQPDEFEHDGFDYLDIRVPSNAEDVPSELGGMSGAGLWQVRFRQARDGSFYVQDYVLSGVAFYEWHAPNRRLRCHGRRSLHERLPKLAESHFADTR